MAPQLDQPDHVHDGVQRSPHVVGCLCYHDVGNLLQGSGVFGPAELRDFPEDDHPALSLVEEATFTSEFKYFNLVLYFTILLKLETDPYV